MSFMIIIIAFNVSKFYCKIKIVDIIYFLCKTTGCLKNLVAYFTTFIGLLFSKSITAHVLEE